MIVTIRKKIKTQKSWWKGKGKFIGAAGAAIIIIAGAGAWGIVSLRGGEKRMDMTNKSDQEIRDYLGSDEFKNLDRQQRRSNARAAMHEMMDRTVNRYFELPQQQRTAYLDKVIDDMSRHIQEMRKMRQQRQSLADNTQSSQQGREDRGRESSRGDGHRGTRRGRTAEGMRARQERHSAESRAKRTEFMMAMRERMKQRGIDMPRPGR